MSVLTQITDVIKMIFHTFFFPRITTRNLMQKNQVIFTHFLCFPAESPASWIHLKMWLLMCKFTLQTFPQSITSQTLQMHSNCTAAQCRQNKLCAPPARWLWLVEVCTEARASFCALILPFIKQIPLVQTPS